MMPENLDTTGPEWFRWRITKYNPRYRDENDNYPRERAKNEWSEFWQIGHRYHHKKFTLAQYLAVEQKYIDAIMGFMECLGVDALYADSVPNKLYEFTAGTKIYTSKKKLRLNNRLYPPKMVEINNNLKQGMPVSKESVALLSRLLLRNKTWCIFKTRDMYIHISDFFYMYIGGKKPCKETIKKIEKSGLFVESNIESTHDDRFKDEDNE
jgi:hypothetical protein